MAKAKKVKKKHYKIHELFKVSGDKIEKLNRTCPKCGKGFFMAKHSNRWACGKCNYTEFGKN